jgi:hypothetical protein
MEPIHARHFIGLPGDGLKGTSVGLPHTLQVAGYICFAGLDCILEPPPPCFEELLRLALQFLQRLGSLLKPFSW